MMDVFTDISSVQSRIAEITGPPSVAAAVPAAAPVDPAAFSNLVSQQLGAGTGLPPTLGMPGPTYPFGASAYGGSFGFGFGSAPGSPAPVAPAEIDGLVSENASACGVDPALVKAVIANESGFDANATSCVGAQGLMQLMPETAASLGVGNAFDPAQNVSGGTRYIKQMLDRFNGNVPLAIAAYNAGPEAVEKYGGIPPYPETQHYVTSVLGSLQRYRSQ